VTWQGLRAARGALVVALILGFAPEVAAQYQPRLRFRVIATDHFRIYYHQGEEPLARRLAGIAESVRSELPGRVGLEAPPVTHVVLANQDDDANGLATPIPYCTVRLTAAWPSLSDSIGNVDHWLRLAFIHEYVHILQLNQSAGWAHVAKVVLGRSPLAFPNLFLPRWQIEGFATFWETRATGLGRLAAGDSADIVRARALVPGGEPLDRANGGAVEWPDGYTPYLAGAWFYDYLSKRFGEDAGGRLAQVTAGRFLYLSAPAMKRLFGKSLGDLWTDFQRDTRAEASALPQSPPIGRQLTRRGYFVTSPRFDDGGRTVVYSVHDADGFPALMATDVASGLTRPIVDRAGGTQLGVRDGLLIFDQLELADNAAWRSDLFAANRRTGRSARLTRDARLLEPDLAADGRRIACLRLSEDGTRQLAVFRATRTGDAGFALTPMDVPIASDDHASYGAPRWSPDGRRLAVERRRPGGPSEIVVFDLADGHERVAAASATSRNIEPTWMPDGSAILFASDRFSRSFQVYAVSASGDEIRRVTDVVGGAMSPDVSPDGQSLVYVGSSAEGYDLFEMPIDPAQWAVVAPEPVVAVAPVPAPVSAETKSYPYSPFPTMFPRAWTPLADTANGEIRVGVGVNGSDVLLRHSVSATLLWRFGDTTATGGPHRGRPDWTAGYVYNRWRPALVVSASDTTTFLPLSRTPNPLLPDAELREQRVGVGVAVPIAHIRYAQVFQAGFDLQRRTLTVTGAQPPRYRNAFRAAWAINTARTYGRSISAEDGIAAAVTSEQVRTAFGADGNADAFTAELRSYLRPVGGHAVLAARGGYGAATGDASVRRQFYLGGTSSAGSLLDFGSNEFRMLRGFDDQVYAGSRIAVASVEWRQPIWRIERGWGTFPVYLRAIHGTLFADGGLVGHPQFALDQAKTSVGAEGSLDVVAGYNLLVTLTAGVAWTHDGTPPGLRGTAVYFRLGQSF